MEDIKKECRICGKSWETYMNEYISNNVITTEQWKEYFQKLFTNPN